jgi:hypothetical protein
LRSGSSGPRPNTSSSRSVWICSFSAEFSSSFALDDEILNQAADRPLCPAIGRRRELLQVELRQQRPVDLFFDLLEVLPIHAFLSLALSKEPELLLPFQGRRLAAGLASHEL